MSDPDFQGCSKPRSSSMKGQRPSSRREAESAQGRIRVPSRTNKDTEMRDLLKPLIDERAYSRDEVRVVCLASELDSKGNKDGIKYQRLNINSLAQEVMPAHLGRSGHYQTRVENILNEKWSTAEENARSHRELLESMLEIMNIKDEKKQQVLNRFDSVTVFKQSQSAVYI